LKVLSNKLVSVTIASILSKNCYSKGEKRHVKLKPIYFIVVQNFSGGYHTFCCHMEITSTFWHDDRDSLFPIKG
jgi:hypothetical protein